MNRKKPSRTFLHHHRSLGIFLSLSRKIGALLVLQRSLRSAWTHVLNDCLIGVVVVGIA
ncbi:hypothetical protein YC2023_030967 [Brassica napus]